MNGEGIIEQVFGFVEGTLAGMSLMSQTSLMSRGK